MKIVLIAHNIRSTHNVGAFFRTCDGLGIKKIILSGYTPYPTLEADTRLPHFADRITRQIHKTALGAETTVNFEHFETLEDVIKKVRSKEALIVALEQHKSSLTPEACRQMIDQKYHGQTVYLILGNELHGVADKVLEMVDLIIEIPMRGSKESLNVSVAAGIALYELMK